MPILGTVASSIRVAAPGVQAYESIASFTVTSATSSITFSSIPQTFTHLQLRMTVFAPSDYPLNVRGRVGNGSVDTGSNYTFNGLVGDSNGVVAYVTTNSVWARWVGFSQGTSNSNYPHMQIIDFHDYTNTAKYKVTRGIGGGASDAPGSGEAGQVTNLWRSTSAIDTIAVYPYYGVTSVNAQVGSMFALYGIKEI